MVRGIRVPRRDAFDAFARSASERSPGIVREFWYFLRHCKKWWMAPIIAVLLALGVLVFLSGTVVAPLIYALF